MKKAGQETTVFINPRIYPLDVIFSAAYVLLDKFYFFLDGDPGSRIEVSIMPKAGNADAAEKEFLDQLVNYAFYKKQAEKNSVVRNAIIQRALAITEIPDQSKGNAESDGEGFEDVDADFIEDPEGIAIPWEEKFGKGKAKGGKNGRRN